ncbi:hypothetical protein CFC21_000702 [Triticum aestivum]|uniref:Uncharacterized protein n=1 Tax=Triticum aestivum TaxID=4565 RepID=A0A3B5XUW6_WHEAT|nr:hypothetical protein CFC21_000702 [Triticum aestivum]
MVSSRRSPGSEHGSCVMLERADDTSADDTTELKWELDEDLFVTMFLFRMISSGAHLTSNASRPSCDHLSENWLFTPAELNSSYYMSVCIEDNSRSQGPEDSPASVGLKVWKTVPFVEDTLVSGTEAVKLIA